MIESFSGKKKRKQEVVFKIETKSLRIQRKRKKEIEEMRRVFIPSRKPNVWEESGKDVATRLTRVKQMAID